ncbi:SixA phosphatase family protein [Occultella kanbiaonis]|uniref:SixA phosphatase family protein n=1 Tax=Occultella kanbiaonis TaxID=2675754 RepID=UPI0012B6F53C|nr:histidine phosphatase family protein [Occultella kanbiaonis]
MSDRTLIVLRHAKSAWDTGEPDHLRPLAPRGLRDGVAAGRVLAGHDLDVVLCSTATRARMTWLRAERAGARCADVRYAGALYGADPDDVIRLVRDLPATASTALVIGHEPTLAEFILDVAQPSEVTEHIAEKFPTAALAVLRFGGGWEQVAAGDVRLESFEVPRGHAGADDD